MKSRTYHKRLFSSGKIFQHTAGSSSHPAIMMILRTENRRAAESRIFAPFQMLDLTDSHIIINPFLFQILIIISICIPGIKAPDLLISFLRKMPFSYISCLISPLFQIMRIPFPPQYLAIKYTVKVSHIGKLAMHMWV